MEKQEKIYGHQMERSLQNISLGEFLLQKLRENGDYVLQIDGSSGNRQTNRELLEKSVKLAKFLQMRGIKIGDRISISSENRLNWLVPACATLYLGAIIAPYNPAYTEWELQNILNIAKPRIIFVSRRTEELFSKILPSLTWPVELIELDDKPLATNVRTLTDILNNEKAVDFSEYKVANIGDNGKHPAGILCSSGTTGLPKGVALSHKNILAYITNISKPELIDLKRDDRIILFMPFYHGYGISLLLLSIMRCCTLVIMPAFEPELFLRLVEEHRITYLPVVPPILTFLAKYPSIGRYDFRSVREISCGAAPLPKNLLHTVKARLGVKCIRHVYGMTEMTMVTNCSAREDEDINSMRYLMSGSFCKVVDLETLETLNAGQVGEICYKGVQVMLGYWGNPEATKQTIDEDGWLHTGDVGYCDEQGGLRVVDRIKELIKYKAYQVSPSEIEIVLLSHPAVKEAAVAGRSDERSGELATALIVKQPGATITAHDIMEFVKKKLSPQKWLHGGVQFVDAIPKNPTGKILRGEIRTIISKL